MGMPELDLPDGAYEFVAKLVERHSRRLDGDGYEVALGDGSQEVVVLGADTLHASQEVVDSFARLLSGGGLFSDTQQPEVKITGLPPETELRSIFLGSARLPNALKRGGINTIGELIALLDSPDSEKRLMEMRDIGEASIAQIREKLGR